MEIDSGQNRRVAPEYLTPNPDRPADKNYIFRLPTVILDRSGLTIPFLRSPSADLEVERRKVKIDDWLFDLSLKSHYGLVLIG